MPYTVALVEDDDMLRLNYTEALQREGYSIISYATRLEASKAFAENLPDLAILDVMLEEEMDGGFTLCSQLRQLSPTIPIIFLTARDSDLDRVSGLRLGAWDYLSKNHTTLDFLPVRISTLFKIMETWTTNIPPMQEEVLTEGELTLYHDQKRAFWQGELIDLTLTEFWLIHALVERPGHVQSHEQLMAAANLVVTSNAIAAHIRRIRDKFREVDNNFDGIRTEYGMGYRWRCS